VICEALDELDYEVFYQVIDGQAFVPQHRERILIVGFDRKRYLPEEMQFKFNIIPKAYITAIKGHLHGVLGPPSR